MKNLFFSTRGRLALLIVSLLLLAACSGPSFNPGTNSEYISLDAEDVVIILSAAGFTNEAIVADGREFRNYLSSFGSASLKDGSTTLALFTARNGLIHISTMGQGSYVYNPGTKELR